MTWRNGHGTGAGQPRIEVSPADELPAGIPGDARDEQPTDRGADGRFARGNALATVAGKRKAGTTRLAVRLSLGAIEANPEFQPYLRSARCFRRAQCAAIARDVGGGVCGPAPSSIVASAALQLAASRFLFDLASQGQPDMFGQASRLADASRQNLLAAHELAAREAKARPAPRGTDAPWLESEPTTPAQDAPSTGTMGNDPGDNSDASDVNVGAARGGDL